MQQQDFKAPKRPFRRMDYTEAIEYLRANNIVKEDDGSFYEFGDVSCSLFIIFIALQLQLKCIISCSVHCVWLWLLKLSQPEIQADLHICVARTPRAKLPKVAHIDNKSFFYRRSLPFSINTGTFGSTTLQYGICGLCDRFLFDECIDRSQ